jgi:protein-disulfide isomerase
MLLVTIAAAVVGIAIVGFLVLQNPGGTTAGPLRSPSATTPPALAHGRNLGSADAPVKVEVYSDFQCPNCELFWTSVEPTLARDEIATGRARLVYHDFSFIGPESLAAATAARCADQQGTFWPYHDMLYANQGRENSGAFADARLAQMATAVDLDLATWSTCRADPATAAAVEEETSAGQARGVTGTPMVYVNGTKLSSYDVATIKAAIATAIGTATPVPVP